MRIAPLGDKVLVRRDPPREKQGRIILAGPRRSALERRSLDGNPSTILAKGPGRWIDRLPSGKKLKKPLFLSTDHIRAPEFWDSTAGVSEKPQRVLLGFHPGVAVHNPEGGDELFFKSADEIGAEITEETPNV